jgi:hypothetical protein
MDWTDIGRWTNVIKHLRFSEVRLLLAACGRLRLPRSSHTRRDIRC